MTRYALPELFVAFILALAHLYGDRLLGLFKSERCVSSFSAGMALSYVFLHLFPELEVGHQLIGGSIHVITLLGLLAFYLADVWARGGDDEAMAAGSPRLWLRVAFIAIYNWLFVFALPKSLSREGIWNTALVGFAVCFHMARSEHSLAEHFSKAYDHRVRIALAGAAFAGWGTIQLVELGEFERDVFTALLAGFLLLDVFREELPKTPHTRWFLGGTATFALPVVLLRVLR